MLDMSEGAVAAAASAAAAAPTAAAQPDANSGTLSSLMRCFSYDITYVCAIIVSSAAFGSGNLQSTEAWLVPAFAKLAVPAYFNCR
jgi:hypothetical protein